MVKTARIPPKQRNPGLGFPHNWLGVRILKANERFRDALHREPGRALRPDWADEAQLLARREQNPRAFAALFQQDPRIQGGNLVNTTQWLTHDPVERRWLTREEFKERTKGLLWVRAWDFAYSEAQTNKDDPDWTVGCLMAIDPHEDLGLIDIYLADIVRFREEWGEGKRIVRDTALRDGPDVWIAGPGAGIEKAAFQDVQGMKSLLAYTKVPIEGSFFNTQGDKYARAQLWAAWAQDGHFWIQQDTPDNRWNGVFIDEVSVFPNGAHEDTIDSASNGYLACVMRVNSDEGGSTVEEDPTMLPSWARGR